MTMIFDQGAGFLPGIDGLALPGQRYLLLPPFATLNIECWVMAWLCAVYKEVVCEYNEHVRISLP